ncbi:WXG100 family type VII secretion target [Nocardioides litoris]|uniref:WXG100 family type VII secretion target n=1 Tax=Nocardioides litoris TaxID=1926648 RepID=UPI001122C00A|nr:WXG100 family type VII secretion target [Nocardioides litoris]
MSTQPAGAIRVDHLALDSTAESMRRCVADIGRRLDRLHSELAPLREDWTGEAQHAYAAAKAAWDRTVAEMRDLLDLTQGAVVTSNQDYRDADRRGAARFGH